MPVHASSVIPTWLNDYWPALYVSLTDKEEWSINNEGSGVVTQFTTLANRLNDYKDVSRSEVVYNLISGIYSYYAMNQNFGLGSLDLTNYEYQKMLSIGAFGTNTLSRGLTYYNDFSLGSSTRLTADINYIDNDAIDEENESIETAQRLLTIDFQSNISKFLFEDPPLSPTQIGKQQVGIYIFNTLLYKNVYNNLSVTPLTLPSYIT